MYENMLRRICVLKLGLFNDDGGKMLTINTRWIEHGVWMTHRSPNITKCVFDEH